MLCIAQHFSPLVSVAHHCSALVSIAQRCSSLLSIPYHYSAPLSTAQNCSVSLMVSHRPSVLLSIGQYVLLIVSQMLSIAQHEFKFFTIYPVIQNNLKCMTCAYSCHEKKKRKVQTVRHRSNDVRTSVLRPPWRGCRIGWQIAILRSCQNPCQKIECWEEYKS